MAHLIHMRRWFAVLMLCASTNVTFGAAEPAAIGEKLQRRLASMEQDILRNPWSAYAELSKLNAAQLSTKDSALYFLRTAQALHLLNHQNALSAAVSAGRQHLSGSTPASTRILLDVFAGIVEERNGNIDRATTMLIEAAHQAARHDLARVRIFALAELAFARCLGGEYETAMRELQQAYALASGLKDDFLVAVVDEVFGVLYSYIEEYDKSIEHYRHALEVYRRLGYLAYEAEATNGIGITYRDWKHWDDALAAFNRYRDITENNASEQGIFTANYGLGTTYADMGDCERALQAIARALPTPGLDDYKAELYKRQAVCLATAGETQQAHAAIEHARAIYAAIPELQGTSWEIDLLRAQAMVLARLGDHAQAFERLLDFHDKTMALQQRNASDRLIKLRVDMESTRKDLQIALLQEQSNVSSLELEQQSLEIQEQRYTIAFWILISCAVIGFVLLQRGNVRRLRELSIKDGLTGLINRRHVFELLAKITASLPLDKGQLSILLFDVDNFKQINDDYGHPAGDQVLKTVAELGLDELRAEDSMARVGGEEFLCLLPRTSRDVALHVAERIMTRIREQQFPLRDGRLIGTTVSMGIASFGAANPDVDTLYACADKALYEAKTSGKNQIRLG